MHYYYYCYFILFHFIYGLYYFRLKRKDYIHTVSTFYVIPVLTYKQYERDLCRYVHTSCAAISR